MDPLGNDPIVVTGSANFSDASTNDNDENMLIIRGNQRVADIYFTEFNRLFNHYYFRSVQEAAQGRRARPQERRRTPRRALFLAETDAWLAKYKPGSAQAASASRCSPRCPARRSCTASRAAGRHACASGGCRTGTMRTVRAVMSIQSSVVYGHVGSTAATLPLQRLGFDVWALPTVVYSSHAGYPGVRGRRTPISTLRELLAGLEALGRLDRCEAVLSGYLGRPEAWRFVLEALAAVRAQRPDAWYVCDPVLGDEGELYVPAELVRTFREQAVPRADLLVPNRFELRVARRPARGERCRGRRGGAASCTRPARARSSSRVSCSSTTAGRRSTSSASTTTAHGSRALRTSPSSGAARAMSSRACSRACAWPGRRSARRSRRATALMQQLIARTHELGAPELRLIEIDWASEPRRRTRRARGLDQPASSAAATSGVTLPPESTSTVPGSGSTRPASRAATGAAAAGSTASLARA